MQAFGESAPGSSDSDAAPAAAAVLTLLKPSAAEEEVAVAASRLAARSPSAGPSYSDGPVPAAHQSANRQRRPPAALWAAHSRRRPAPEGCCRRRTDR